jgi:hypothetical protein
VHDVRVSGDVCGRQGQARAGGEGLGEGGVRLN